MNTVIRDYLRVFLSAPPMAGIAILVFVIVFRADIRGLMGRVATIRFPGGELSTSQLERTAGETSAAQRPGNATPSPPEPPAQIPTLDPALRQFVEAERMRARLWEYRYLNFYLVPNTQRVLDWLASLNQRTTVPLFDAYWTPLLPNPNERHAIIQALQNHYLIQVSDIGLIDITPKGREYINWRGPVLPQPVDLRRTMPHRTDGGSWVFPNWVPSIDWYPA